MKIQIDAVDTLFFRDGKPFSGGEDNWAETLFPPAPSVIYGALRGAYFANHIQALDKATEDDDPTRNLIIKAIALQVDNRLLFPSPLDCVRVKGSQENKVFVLKHSEQLHVSNCPVNTVRLSEGAEIVENIKDGLLKSNVLKLYLQGQTDNLYCDALSDYTVSEPKIGIARDNHTHTSEDGMLYRVDMHRLESEMKCGKSTQTLSLFVEFEGFSLPDKGLLRLGGEGKAAYYRISDAKLIEPLQLDASRFKLYLASPAMFEQGWLPTWLNIDTLENEEKLAGSLKIRLETALLGKPLSIGGFDMKEREPKVMRRAVPAGSVYYFKILEGTMQDVIARFHHQRISDYEPRQGFGLTFVGGVV